MQALKTKESVYSIALGERVVPGKFELNLISLANRKDRKTRTFCYSVFLFI